MAWCQTEQRSSEIPADMFEHDLLLLVRYVLPPFSRGVALAAERIHHLSDVYIQCVSCVNILCSASTQVPAEMVGDPQCVPHVQHTRLPPPAGTPAAGSRAASESPGGLMEEQLHLFSSTG